MPGGRVAFAAVAAVAVAGLTAQRGHVERARGDIVADAAQIGQPGGAAAPAAADGPVGRVALAGPWTLRGDRPGRGTIRGWPAGNFAGSTVDVPNSPNARRISGPQSFTSFRGSVGWYSTAFTVPTAGAYAIRFESVNHKATVWLDGRELGRHTGEYLPFEYDVNLDAARSHRLVVRADWRDPYAMKRAAWHRTWFNFGGVNREVTVRPLAASKLTAPTVNTRLHTDGSAAVDLGVHVTNRSPAPREIGVQGALVHGDSRIPVSFVPVMVPAGADRVLKTTVAVTDPALWAPGSPNLYDLSLEVPGETSYALKTGLREVSRKGSRLLLNGKPITLRGASIHEDAKGVGDALSGADMDDLVRDLQSLGANATRSQHPLSPALLERLDAAGIMVWQGIGPVDAPGAWTSKTAALRAQSKRRVRTTLFQAQTHPSIIVWNLANEVAGNGHPGGQASYIDQMAQELHRRDPGRLVGLDVWGAHPPKHAGPMYDHIDAIGDTNYIGWYEEIKQPRAVVRQKIRDHVAFFRRVFAGKVLAVTEFGAEANGLNATNTPGGYAFQARLLRDHIDIYSQARGVSGMLVWNLRDFAVSPEFAGGSIRRSVPNIHLIRGLNQKGLFDYAGKPKPAVAVVRAALARAAG